MNLPRSWARLSGPADFLDVVVEDLADRNSVLIGVPHDTPGDEVAVEVADRVGRRGFGRWKAIRSAEASGTVPSDSVARRIGNGANGLVLWVDVTRDDRAAAGWTHHAKLHAEFTETPRVCIAMNMDRATECEEEKRLRRRVWRDFVTATDSRALAERIGRRSSRSAAHIALKSALVAELAGADLALANRLARESLGRIHAMSAHRPEHIWAAQLSILLPLVERERQRLLDVHETLWRLPHTRENGRGVVQCREYLEIGDMAAQARWNGALAHERRHLEWLRQVRNTLAHNEVVRWSMLTSQDALRVADFRE